MVDIQNIFSDIPESLHDEFFQDIFKNENFRIERIVSKGHSSKQDFWYDQEKNEWVILLKGCAKLLFKDDNKPVILKPGDWVNIPAHKKHRVEWTDPDTETVWLAVHY
jgi:cupin 2 domain-containing protein